MKVIGIIAEYNPFHNGHEYQIRTLRERYGMDSGIIAVMSGDYVQRGEPAVFSKHARAEAAVHGGVSLVIELPLPWSISSAETFAGGGISLLKDTGVVDILSFGTEVENTEWCKSAADAIDSEEYADEIKTLLKEGIPFAKAREQAVSLLKGENAAIPLRTPNSNLGVEYIRAVKRLGADMEIAPVLRSGSEHDGPGSASSIRLNLLRGELSSVDVPAACAGLYYKFIQEGRGPYSLESLFPYLLPLLRSRTIDDFRNIPDAAEGLENLLTKAAATETDIESMISVVKSKRYTYARCRRMILMAALGIHKEDILTVPPYIRILAMDSKGKEILRRMKTTACKPVIIKPSEIRKYPDDAMRVFERNSFGTDILALCSVHPEDRKGRGDYIHSPIIL